MEINESQKNKEGQFRIILGREKGIPGGLSEEDKRNWEKFQNLKDDYVLMSDLDSGIVMVKCGDKNEKIRSHGAKAWEDLKMKSEYVEVKGEPELVYSFMEGMSLASYSFDKYKTSNENEPKLTSVYSSDLSEDQAMELAHIQQAVFWTRDLVNEPVSYLTAEQLADEIVVMSGKVGIQTKVLEKAQIESLKMGGLLAVNKGSVDPPTFTILEYKPDQAVNDKPVVLVGKGVVYDTGGLSLKPTPNSMDVMKSDMGGAACMAGAMYLIAAQKLPVHIIGLIPATDNRPGLNAYAPGDVIQMFDGTTVEVLNTDAEGRMILADALAYSKKFDPEIVIDAATLTGAAHRAIGDKASIVMGNAENRYFTSLEEAGDAVYERVVQFPFWEEYMEEMKSSIADLKNIGGPTAGMITAGKFLEHFVKAPYIHMDIAGPAWLDKKNGYRTAGGSGVGVRLLYEFFKNWKNG